MPIISIDDLEKQSTPIPSGKGNIIPIDQMESQGGETQPKPFFKAIGADMTPAMKTDHPVLAGVEQTAQDVATLGEKAANGLTLGGLDYGLRKGGIEPPNFDNTALENKSGLNMMGDAANIGSAGKTIGTLGSKVVAPAAKAVAKAVPEGLKNTSYSLMQSIVNQLPKEFKYGANAGRAMVKEKLSGDAADIKQQADQRISEIGGEGDKLASSSNKPVNNSNAIKVIDDKISELQSKSPRTSAATIGKLQDAKKDLLGVIEDSRGNVIDEGKNVSNMTPKETLDLKRDFDDQTQWKGTASDDTVFNKTMQQARGTLKDNLNDAVPGMKDWNQRYADLRAAQQAAGRRVTYDQAGAGLKNIINNAVRGTIGVTTLGAALHGNGELAGEIIAGWGAKEVLGNPMVKSKLAQALYNISEADKSAIFKAVPWLRKGIGDTMENFRQKPRPSAEPVDAELVDNRPQGLPAPPQKIGLNRALPSPMTSGLRTSGPTIYQSGNVPKELPEPFQGRSGVDRPWENKGLPSPRNAGQSSGPVIKQGTSFKQPPNTEKMYPRTDFGHQIKYQMQREDNVPLHPAEAGREELERLYPTAVKGNPNIYHGDIDDFNDMKDWELHQNPGGWKSHGSKDDLSFTKSNTGHSDAFKKVSGNSEKVGFDLLKRASNGEEMTNGEKLKIKMMIADFRKNIKPKM